MNINNSPFTTTTDSQSNQNILSRQYDYFNIDSVKSLKKMTSVSRKLTDRENSLDNSKVKN